MPLTLTTEDIDAIGAAVAARLAAGVVERSGALLPFRLTVQQFACATQRCRDTIRREIRARNIKAKGKPYLINTDQLDRFDVGLALAHERLKQANLLAGESAGGRSSPDKPRVPSTEQRGHGAQAPRPTAEPAALHSAA